MTGPPLELRTTSAEGTEAAGRAVGAVLEAGDLLALDGPLGAGKTCLVRGLVAGLGGASSEVRSPTFVLHQVHAGGRLPLHHLDLYRLGDGTDVSFLDLEELLEVGVVAVEWASRADLEALAPIRLSLDPLEDGCRRIRLGAGGPARVRRAWAALGAG